MEKLNGKLLVANRGEIAIRIFRAAAELGLPSVAVYPEDDIASLHTRKADQGWQLPGRGTAAYLDVDAMIHAALETGATMIHPGYGFLSENTDLARACASNGLVFIGPGPDTIELFGDKHKARQLAIAEGVPVLPGTTAPTTLAQARSFFAEQRADSGIMVKAVAGGGGRGIRPVSSLDELEEAFTRAASEAVSGFGNGDLYVELQIKHARHIEIQILGDGTEVSHLWERDCSLQRRRQKLVELAPAPRLDASLRQRLIDDALRLGRAVGYRNLGTVEFLVDSDTGEYFFIEVNPRLQVEHTVTEEVTGLNLVELQIQLAQQYSLADLGLTEAAVPQPRGIAMQVRINAETVSANGDASPGGGQLNAFEVPSGRGIRVDSYGYVGYRTNPSFDSLLGKLIVHTASQQVEDVLLKGYRALCEFHIAGVPTNLRFLQSLLRHPELAGGAFDTGFVGEHATRLASDESDVHPNYYFDPDPNVEQFPSPGNLSGKTEPVLSSGQVAVRSPYQGTVVSLAVADGEPIRRGTQLLVVEAMKMEYVITADASGRLDSIHVQPGDVLEQGQLLLIIHADSQISVGDDGIVEAEVDLDHIRPDLAEVLARRSMTLDESRPEAVAKRRRTGQRTARENVYDLVDAGTFVEYGSLVVAAQRRRRRFEDLVERSPADGIITGIGRINGESFGDPASRVAVMSYDYTVFAGTQGVHNHWKTDRMIDIAEQGRLPVVLFAEGGGGRPGDDDYPGFPGIDTFHHFSRLSALVPIVGVVSGRCFAGNAALLGCCDVIVATRNTNIGMGGPAMIEGGGLGVVAPEDIGPVDVQTANGVIDILVEDESEAVAVAKRYLSYFQGPVLDWDEPDQRRMRSIVPENRLRAYEVRQVIETLADEGTVLELRRAFGRSMVTALVRVEGRAVGVVANDPGHLGGAIDSDAADKAARFMQICDSFDLPILYLSDTPGIMVGPEVEKTALVRHAARLFLVGSNLSVPVFSVVLRKAYGLGAVGMVAGDNKVPVFTVTWPTGEFGPMGLEGQVKLGFRAELAAIEDLDERQRVYEDMLAKAYESGKALEQSTNFTIVDETIDPAETRFWLVNILSSLRPPTPRDGKKRPMIDAW